MKIGIITFHFVNNQGAVLQSYALQKYLSNQGHDVQIIDYRPKYHTVRYSPWKNPIRYSLWYYNMHKRASIRRKSLVFAKSFVRCMYWNLLGTHRTNSRLFNRFTSNYLNLTTKYESIKALQKHPPKMDAYITGSDQLWNPDLLDHDFDEAYFLNFGSNEIRKIAYAVSIGKKLSEDECRKINILCEHLDAVSLRESTPELLETIDRDVHICVDPTLLLDADDYLNIESDVSEKEPYVFVYGLETSEDIRLAVQQVGNMCGYRVINGTPETVKLNGMNIINASDYAPDRFLSYIKNAEFVVTNSFHGTVFSILYKKKFITVPHTTRGRRMIELLYKLGLNSALWGAPEFSIENEIDYKSVYGKLSELRRASADYLEKALSGCRGEDIPHSIEEAGGYIDISLNG
ncbi:MAG: polysaccharide pyruvyl transferase family protein [Clostridia bacterium]|nr:polysaccharide pyruvyl transferase family protein [Clostridia bacterium]